MKGDFTRFTFQPAKHYTSVLMQQGRLQLDADWNEQMSIQAYLSQSQAEDMIGASGASRVEDGFRISPTPDGSDLLINPGHFYVGGQLCELFMGSPIVAIFKSPDSGAGVALKVQVPTLVVDGVEFAADQWVEVLPTSGKNQLFRITAADPNQKELTLESRESLGFSLSPTERLQLRRISTYQTQPDHPSAVAADLPTGLVNGTYLVYLDVWQRHITTIEDPDLQEIALGVPDTATRLKTLWQVRLLPQDQQVRLFGARQVAIAARLRPAEASPGLPTSASSQRLDNQLYRIEIHNPGPPGTATFKWSRDNGTVVSAIETINPRDNVILVRTVGRDAAQSFAAGQWVEVSDDQRDLNNQPGTLARLDRVLPGGKLVFDPATITGDAIDLQNFPLVFKPRVRRWDWTSRDAGLPTTSTDPEGWVDLENSIQVRFQVEPNSAYRTGDYWLIPSRTVTNAIAWPQDDSRQPLLQPPLGIEHRYTRLALVDYQDGKFQPLKDESDLRTTFPPLKDCFDKSGDFIEGSLGIGVRNPQAKLHVRGIARGFLVSQVGDPQVTGVDTVFLKELTVGSQITAAGQTREVRAIADNTRLTVNTPFSPPLSGVPFHFQQPVLRLDTGDGTPQFVLNARGNVAIGTPTPDAKLTVQGTTSDSTAAGFHVKNAAGISLLFIRNSGQVGIGTASPADTARLDINGSLRVGSATTAVQLTQTSTTATFTTDGSGYSFDKSVSLNNSLTVAQGITVTKGNVSLNNGDLTLVTGHQVKIGSLTLQDLAPQLSLGTAQLTMLPGSGNIGIGTTTDPKSSLDVVGNVNIGFASAEARPTLTNGLSVKGDTQIMGGVAIGFANGELDAIPTNGLRVRGNARVGGNLRIIDLSSGDGTRDFVQIARDNDQATFTSGGLAGGYSFDNKLTVSTGGITATGGITVPSGGITVEAGGITVDATGISVNNGAASLTSDLTLTSGSLTVGSGTISAGSLSGTSSNLSFRTAQTQRLVILSSGAVGIGESSPTAMLEIKDTTPTATDSILLRVKRSDNAAVLTVKDTGEVALGDNAKSGTLTVSGKVSVGSNPKGTVPDNSLRVQGDVIVDGALQARGDAIADRILVNIAALPSAASNATLYVNGEVWGRSVTASEGIKQLSSRTLKSDIASLSSQEASTLLQELNPVKFAYTADQNQQLHLGFIAEEVPVALSSPDRQSIQLTDIIAVLTQSLKDHQKALTAINRIVKTQQETIAQLGDRLVRLEKQSQPPIN